MVGGMLEYLSMLLGYHMLLVRVIGSTRWRWCCERGLESVLLALTSAQECRLSAALSAKARASAAACPNRLASAKAGSLFDRLHVVHAGDPRQLRLEMCDGPQHRIVRGRDSRKRAARARTTPARRDPISVQISISSTK